METGAVYQLSFSPSRWYSYPMPRGLKLTPQLLVLVTAPILVELALLFSLLYLHSEADLEAQRLGHALSITRVMQKLHTHMSEIAAENLGERSLRISLPPGEFERQVKRAFGDYRELERLVADSPEELKVVEESKRSASRAVELILETRRSYIRAPEAEAAYRKTKFAELRFFIPAIMSDDMESLGRKFDEVVDSSPEKQAEVRRLTQQVIVAGGITILLLSALLALFIVKRITGRLKVMNENAYRLASGKPLSELIGGADELAELDQTFHKMAAAMNQSLRKEQAVVENARDIIMTVDAQEKILTINNASSTILGATPDDLRGLYVIELMETDDIARAQEFFGQMRRGSEQGTIELALNWKGRRSIHTLWSVRFDSVENSLFCVVHDISERKATEELKAELLAMVSHDLRTPITTVQNFFEMFNEGLLGSLSEKGVRMATHGEANCRRMIGLINDLLDIEKTKSGSMPFESERVDVQHLIDLSVMPLQEWAREQTVTIETGQVNATVIGDESKLVRVISNLLGNAIKFSPSGGTVRLTASVIDDSVEVAVSDEGVGIPPDMLESVFERYRQIHGKKALKGGSGLGLTICKEFITLHGGKIWAESTTGKGSTFKFVLPLAPVS